MFLRKKKTETEVLFAQLTLMRDWAKGRIDAGDLDIDDVIHRTYRSADNLLTIWNPQEAENEQA